MKRKIGVILAAAAMLVATAAAASAEEKIQLAILLDTSNSMDGLIGQAKAQLWNVVNELARTKRHGVHPTLEVALFQYGNDGLSEQSGYIEMVSDLTTDLDRISEKLFQLTTDGGYEYCGQVIDRAVSKLSWSSSNDVLKVIYIAGNEPFTQGLWTTPGQTPKPSVAGSSSTRSSAAPMMRAWKAAGRMALIERTVAT